jgi:lactoylglutathione lyase
MQSAFGGLGGFRPLGFRQNRRREAELSPGMSGFKVTGIVHVTINISAVDESFFFYEKVLQLKRLDSIEMGDHILTYFSLSESCRLELIEYRNDDSALRIAESAKGAYRHMALSVDDLDAIRENCASNNVVITLEPRYVSKLACRIMLIRDPNGVEIELVEK